MISILLVDDQALLCEVLKTWLEVEQDFQVVGVAHNGEQALDQVEVLQPDIVLMDIDMPGMNGLSATKIICERFPQVKVIFLSAHDDDNYLGKSLKAGAKGYLLKNTTAEELAHKIRAVYHNQTPSLPKSDDSVIVLKTQLEELIETYRHKFQKQLEEGQFFLETLNQTNNYEHKIQQRLNELENLLIDKIDNCDQRLIQLEIINGNTWESLRSEALELQTQMNESNRNLSSQMNQQIVNLRRELDTQLANALEDWARQRAALQEWAVQRDEMRPSLEEFEIKYRTELMAVINPMRASFRDIDKQMRMMRNCMIAAILTAAMSLSLASWVLVSHGHENNSPAANTSEVN
ncbi:response regulator receiver protein [Stanieria cyanosphaera PCC 7437]|uniref:Response regulator receiver protein n=1 Tax=Stanieria cyanosphaera (strain ATCC 29371 / PCC 7437) TaxID=111780 RepID=K9XVN2_STAC7|nr:response regulator transcription factor [Stanieria cyanosphaera]AFZ36650.1 response regulator receiver protein [Stanieria cyanosphaera PCC 7437]